MGVGLAQNLAQTGHKVILVDISQEQLDRVEGEIRQNIRMQGFFRKSVGKTAPKGQTMLSSALLRARISRLSQTRIFS